MYYSIQMWILKVYMWNEYNVVFNYTSKEGTWITGAILEAAYHTGYTPQKLSADQQKREETVHCSIEAWVTKRNGHDLHGPKSIYHEMNIINSVTKGIKNKAQKTMSKTNMSLAQASLAVTGASTLRLKGQGSIPVKNIYLGCRLNPSPCSGACVRGNQLNSRRSGGDIGSTFGKRAQPASNCAAAGQLRAAASHL